MPNQDGYALIAAQCTRTHKKMLHALQLHFSCSGSEVIRELIENAYGELLHGELSAPARRFRHTDGRVYPKALRGVATVVPAGYKLVPLSPTAAMVDAGLAEHDTSAAPEDEMAGAYRAMVAAAPGVKGTGGDHA